MGDSSVSHSLKGSSPPPTGWVELTGGDFSKVSFIGVKQQYSVGEDIIFHVQFAPGDSVCKWDKVSLTAFGKTHEPSYISLIGLHSVGVTHLEVKFAQNILPKNTEFYQFLYLRGNVVLGASPPFFLQSSQDDVLSVSSEDDFLVVHQVGEKEKEGDKDAPQGQEPSKQQEIYASSCSALTEVSDVTDGSSTTSDSTAAASVNSADCKLAAASSEPKIGSYNWSSSGGLFPGSSEKEASIDGDASPATASKIKTSEWLQQWYKQMPTSLAKELPLRNPAAEKLFSSELDTPVFKALKLVIKKEKEKNEALTEELVVALHLNDTLKDALEGKDDKIKALEVSLDNEKKARETSLKEVISLTCTRNVMEMELKEKQSKIEELKHKNEEMQNAKLEIPACMSCSSKDAELQHLKVALENEKEENEISTQKAQNYSQSMKTLQMELQVKRTKIEQLLKSVEDGQKDKEILMDQILNLTKENENLQSENERKASLSSSSCSRHMREIEDAETMLHVLEASKVLALQEIKSQKVVEGKLRASLQNMREEYDELNKKLQAMKEQIEELKEQEAILREDNETLKAKERLLEQHVRNMRLGKSCRDYDVEKAVTVEGMQLRLAEAATLYKQQFIEIRTLKRQLKKLQKSHQRVLNAWKNGVPGTSEWRDLADETTSSSAASRKSDSDTGEFIKTVDGYSVLSVNTACVLPMAESKMAVREEAYQMQAPPEIPPPPATVRATAPLYTAEMEMQSDAGNVAAPLIGNSFVRANTAIVHGIAQNPALNLFSETAPPQDAQEFIPEEPAEAVKSSIHCPYCDEKLFYADDELSSFIVHLHEKHDQLVCPICGAPYDATLPVDYFQLHVENHFTEN